MNKIGIPESFRCPYMNKDSIHECKLELLHPVLCFKQVKADGFRIYAKAGAN